MNSRHGHAAMLLFAFLVAGSFSLGGRIANMVDPTVLTLVRFILAAGVLGASPPPRGGSSGNMRRPVGAIRCWAVSSRCILS